MVSEGVVKQKKKMNRISHTLAALPSSPVKWKLHSNRRTSSRRVK
jgi:hypothetical protein